MFQKFHVSDASTTNFPGTSPGLSLWLSLAYFDPGICYGYLGQGLNYILFEVAGFQFAEYVTVLLFNRTKKEMMLP